MTALAGKSVLVTGGARRVGKALVLAFARAGAAVGIHFAHAEEEAHQTAREVRQDAADVATFRADLRRLGEVELLADAVAARFDGLDVLVNSAAAYQRTPVGDTAAADWDALFELNARAPFFLTQALAPALRRRSSGSVLMIGDIAADQGWPHHAPYVASKAALSALTRSLAVALAPEVRVNAILPGTVMPPADFGEAHLERELARTPLGRLGSAADVAAAAVFLAGEEFVTGALVPVDGGRRLV